MVVHGVAVSALESHAAVSEFKAQWSHNFYFLIEIESHCIPFSYKLGQHLRLAQNG